MSCKCLASRRISLLEAGASDYVQVEMPACAIGREPDIDDWALQCAETAIDGPCWVWQMGLDVLKPDPELRRQHR